MGQVGEEVIVVGIMALLPRRRMCRAIVVVVVVGTQEEVVEGIQAEVEVEEVEDATDRMQRRSLSTVFPFVVQYLASRPVS